MRGRRGVAEATGRHVVCIVPPHLQT
jgi:hypothetical protein